MCSCLFPFSSHLILIVDIEFGRLQARDMLQHLWTGPISNVAVDVVQGSRSVEVRSVGVTKVGEVDSVSKGVSIVCMFVVYENQNLINHANFPGPK